MEEGSLRCDANVSVRPRASWDEGGSEEFEFVPVFVARAGIRDRAAGRRGVGRQRDAGDAALECGGGTDGFDAIEGIRARLRYFPDPDLLPVMVMEPLVAEVRRGMPELPAAKMARFVESYGIAAYDAGVLTAESALADYFEAVVKAGAGAKVASSWISVELLRRLKDAGKDIGDCPVKPAALAGLLKKVEGGEITAASGKKVFEKMFETGKSAEEIITSEGLAQISDARSIETVARQVVTKSPENVAKYKSGNEGVFKFFVGQVMKETRGQANPDRE